MFCSNGQATHWEYPDMQINAWDKVAEGHYYTIAVVQLHSCIISSEAHHCEWRSTGTHCGNGWMGTLKVLYLELKAKAASKF